MHLLVQYYEERNPRRCEELLFCLRKNLEHPRVKAVHDLQEVSSPPPDIRMHPKYVQVDHREWLTYDFAFDYARKQLESEIVGLVNLDVFLHGSFDPALIAEYPEDTVLALSRWEYDPTTGECYLDKCLMREFMGTSQDMWVFRSPIRPRRSDFRIGTLGCDNAIAHRLVSSGYRVVNDCLRFRICHFDVCRGKNSTNAVEFHRRQRIASYYPGNDGQSLVPMRPECISLDEMAQELGFDEMEKYAVMQIMVNRRWQLKTYH